MQYGFLTWVSSWVKCCYAYYTPQYTAIVFNNLAALLVLPVILIWMEISHDLLIYFLQTLFRSSPLFIWSCRLPPPNNDHSPFNPPSNSKILMPIKPWNSDSIYGRCDWATQMPPFCIHALSSNAWGGRNRREGPCVIPLRASLLSLYSILIAIYSQSHPHVTL